MQQINVNLQVIIRLNKGLGISLVDRTLEELVYVMFRDVATEYVQENDEQKLTADVHSIQVHCVIYTLLMSSVWPGGIIVRALDLQLKRSQV